MDKARKLQMTGYVTFLISGICSISSGVVVSHLQELYGFSFSTTGTLLSCMSIGNMAAAFLAGVLPAQIGQKGSVALLCSGYFLGYMLMAISGLPGLLMLAFCMAGIAKGCALNNCTVMVGNNAQDRTKSISLLHGCYALGALVCPFLVAGMAQKGDRLPMVTIAVLGLAMWMIFMASGLPGKPAGTAKKEKTDLSFLKSAHFWLLTALVFCQNAAETSVSGWLVTYYRNQQILSGALSNYTVTIMWGATLIARLIIAFALTIHKPFRAVAIMGVGCTVLYAAMMFASQPLWAVVMLFAFAFAMAGVNPVAVGAVGKLMSTASMGVLLPVAALGAIVMPWIIGLVADAVSLQAGMVCNLVPCIGILVLSIVIHKREKRKEEEIC